ncbi:MAG: class I SAM-dependent methyltransferase [Hydrotalea sp.]|nr:class I SAM-dependent methyltransferase [Hydrotalea sp.]
MENFKDEISRLSNTCDIYSTEAGRLNRDIISYSSSKLIEKFCLNHGRALQLGLGDAFIANKLDKIYDEFVILEGSKEVIMRFKNPEASYTVIETLFEEFEQSEYFDILLANHVLEHVENPVEVMIQAKKSLRKGGKAIFTVPNADSLHRRIGVEMGLLSQRNDLNSQDIQLGHRRVYTVSDFTNDIESAGFKILEVKGYMIKLVSNAQMKDWSKELLDAIFEVSLSSPAEICSNIAVICES